MRNVYQFFILYTIFSSMPEFLYGVSGHYMLYQIPK